MKRVTFREDRKLKAFIKAVKEKAGSKYVGRVEVLENQILKAHDEIQKELRKLEKIVSDSGSFGKPFKDTIKGNVKSKNMGEPFASKINLLKSGINDFDALLQIIITKQNTAYTATQALIADTKRFWK